MGVLTQKALYRDNTDTISLHTTPGDGEYEPQAGASNAAPPTYADATVEGPVSGIPGVGINHPTPARLPSGIPTGIQFRALPADTNSKWWHERKVIGRNTQIVCETNELQERATDTDPEYLEQVIREMARHAPTPIIQIIGTHTEQRYNDDGKKSSYNRVTDFKILINMRNYLWPDFNVHSSNSMELRTVENGEKVYRGTVLKARAPGYKAELEVGDARPDLKEWCHRYCASSTSSRMQVTAFLIVNLPADKGSFRLERRITNFDTSLLMNRIEGLIRSSNYRGHLEITFPVADRYVDIYTTTRLQTWRLKTWIRLLFLLTFFWIFSWPLLFFTTKRYSVVRAEWPFAIIDARGHKTYTTVSEEDWISRFGLAIRQLALDRYQGEAGDDFLSLVMARPETTRDRSQDIDVGRAVNSAVNAWRGGLNVGNLMRLGSSNDQIGWGFDT